MPTHEATFEIDSKRDAYAVQRMLEQTYNTVREESRSVRDGTDDATELLASFEELKKAAQQPTPGRLTITYEETEGEFDG